MKRMSKIICGTLAVVLAMGVSLTGCNKQETPVSDQPYDYDLTQYVKLGQYKGVEIEPYDYEITEEVVQQQIDLALANYAQLEKKTDAIETGDKVNIDFTGYMDGEAFDGGSATSYSLTIGSGAFIPGFEAGLIGAKAGDTVTLDIQFPDPYSVNPDFAGQPVRFEVKINSVYRQTMPEYTDEFVSEYYGYSTVAEFETALRASIQEQYDYNKEYYMMSQVWGKIQENAEFIAYPEKEYNEMYDSFLSPYTTAAANASMTLSDFLAASEEMTESEFYALIDEEAKAAIGEEMIFYQLVRQENITFTDAEYAEQALELANQSGFETVEEMLAYTGYAEEDLRKSLLFEKLLTFLVDNAVVKTAEQ